ncbi:MFS transporter [Phytohabitans flavus]|uniref:MFS transporter n=1 Tax=Phytohabitans flavus TaxID=1076124 RepID=A0A6F8XUI3_9ACTN|nr:MFS transporter [Phytohabitans flavus]BCB77485.1 MFS transporter [Phytohabitans flavus]
MTQPLPHRWRALWVTLVAGFMTLLDVSIVAVALPSMLRELDATPASVQWVVSGYALTFGLTLVAAGRLGDALGRRRMFLFSLAAFILFSAAAGAAPSIETLVIARLAQGIASGSLAPQNSGLIQQLFSGAERGRAFGLFGATIGISTAVGPVLGGLILAVASWRWIFFVNVPIGLVALVLAARLLPRTRGEGSVRGQLDPPGVLLLGGAVLTAMLPLVQAENGGLRRLWWLFPVAAALIGAFLWWEARTARRGRQPLLDLRLLTQTPGYAGGIALGTVYFVGFSGIWLVLALYLQEGLGWSPLHSGLAVTPFSVGSAAAAVIAGRLVNRLGRRLTVIGLLTVVVGLVATALTLRYAPAWAVAPALLIGGVGSGLVISPNITLTLRNVPVEMAGAAGGALQTGQRVGAAVGTALLPGLYFAVLATTHRNAEAVMIAVCTAAAATAVALLIAGAEWRADHRRPRGEPKPELQAHGAAG